jgi:hypothetical protein
MSAHAERCRQLGSEGRLTARQVGLARRTMFRLRRTVMAHKGVADLLQAFDRIYNKVPKLPCWSWRWAGKSCEGRCSEPANPLGGPTRATRRDRNVARSRRRWFRHTLSRASLSRSHGRGLPVVASDRVGAVDDPIDGGTESSIDRDVDELASGMETWHATGASSPLAAGASALITGWTLRRAQDGSCSVEEQPSVKSLTRMTR